MYCRRRRPIKFISSATSQYFEPMDTSTLHTILIGYTSASNTIRMKNKCWMNQTDNHWDKSDRTIATLHKGNRKHNLNELFKNTKFTQTNNNQNDKRRIEFKWNLHPFWTSGWNQSDKSSIILMNYSDGKFIMISANTWFKPLEEKRQ